MSSKINFSRSYTEASLEIGENTSFKVISGMRIKKITESFISFILSHLYSLIRNEVINTVEKKNTLQTDFKAATF